MSTKYSVLMSVYDREDPKYLKLSIESILGQTLKPDEFVIVCDGKLTSELTDVLETFITEYGELIKLVQLPENKGLGIALNEGLAHCSNETVARMDSDDISAPDRMERQIKVLNEKGLDIVSGTVTEFANDINEQLGRRDLPATQEEILKFARRRNPFNHPAVVYKKSSVEKAGGYQDFKFFEDYYLWIRMLLNGCEAANIKETVVYMRVGNGMYKRRGGISYAKQIIKFRWFMLKSGFSGIMDFIITAGGHTVVALVPNAVRGFIYERVLRK